MVKRFDNYDRPNPPNVTTENPFNPTPDDNGIPAAGGQSEASAQATVATQNDPAPVAEQAVEMPTPQVTNNPPQGDAQTQTLRPEQEAQAAPEDPNAVRVKVIDNVAKDGKLYAIDQQGNGYLIDADKLQFSSAFQPVSHEVLDASERPYNWDEEIDRLMPDRNRLRQHLWRMGLRRKEDVEDSRNRDILESVFPKIS